ncbi:MAG: PH domain-containing protein [Candidatus Hadarchaeales archaeon]
MVQNKFKPDPNLKKVYGIYLLLAGLPLFFIASIPVWGAYKFAPEIWREYKIFTFIPLGIVTIGILFVAYWIPRYYDTIFFTIEEDEITVERGVWWKMKHTVPYSRVMCADVIQGPISRFFGLGSVHIYTAGYTGAAGGTAGPGTRGAEASIWGIPNFLEIREIILKSVKNRPLFAQAQVGLEREILEELKQIRKILEKTA